MLLIGRVMNIKDAPHWVGYWNIKVLIGRVMNIKDAPHKDAPHW